jgi:hypothetical protein
MEIHREKIKTFLNIKLNECEGIIAKYKKKYRIVKIIYYSVMTTSIIGSTTISIISPVIIPPIVFSIISATTAIVIAISLKLNIENTKIKLNKKIQELCKIKDKLDYVVNCNGNLTEDECNRILIDFRSL